MKLYYSPGTSSLAPHIVLRELDRPFDLERVDLTTHRTAAGRDYKLVNPKGYVPALQLDATGAVILTEAHVILQFLAELEPERHLSPPWGTYARYHLLEVLGFIATEIHKQFSALSRADTPAKVAAILRGKIGERLLQLQDVLYDKGFLMGETFSVADAYLFAMLQWCGKYGIDLQLFPNLDAYEDRIAQRPAVMAAMRTEGLEGRHRYLRSA